MVIALSTLVIHQSKIALKRLAMILGMKKKMRGGIERAAIEGKTST